jgi:copper ion binding protein
LKIIPARRAPKRLSGAAVAMGPSTKEIKVHIEHEGVVATYLVKGMTCGHCVASVTEEVAALEGVTWVDVDLDSGRVTVSSAAPLSEADVRTAVDEAGYQLAA